MSSNYFTFDKSQFPIVIIKLNPIEPTVDDINEMFDAMEDVFSTTTGPVITITDNTNGINWLSSSMRIAIGKRVEALNNKYHTRNLAAVLVFTSPMARIMLKGVNLVVKNQTPQHIVKDMDEAINTSRKLLNEYLMGITH